MPACFKFIRENIYESAISLIEAKENIRDPVSRVAGPKAERSAIWPCPGLPGFRGSGQNWGEFILRCPCKVRLDRVSDLSVAEGAPSRSSMWMPVRHQHRAGLADTHTEIPSESG